jgi:hypothetical protein
MNPHANDNSAASRRFTIAADANKGETSVDIKFPSALPNNRKPRDYKVVKKDIPDKAKNKSYGGKKVKWFNNFGIRIKGNLKVKNGGNKQDPFFDEVEGEQFTYEVIVPGSSKPSGYNTLVYFDGTNVQPANPSTDSDGNYHFNLNIGDPPNGWGG